MNVVAKFEKVSFEQFKEDWLEKQPTSKTQWNDEEIKEIYDSIELPKRGTTGSAGYDIFAPCDLYIASGEARVVPTGLRCRIENGWFLDINPRSGIGFKFGLRLANTRGIIDSDYYHSDNEGHIMLKFINDSCIGKDFKVEAGTGMAQGIFTIYGITEDDNVSAVRNGGFGSTGN